MGVLNYYEKLRGISDGLRLYNDEIKKAWGTQSGSLYISSFEDAQVYISKILDKTEEKLSVLNTDNEKEETLSDFSFD